MAGQVAGLVKEEASVKETIHSYVDICKATISENYQRFVEKD